MAKVREIKKIAIVLSGGLARGAAQLAFAKEIVEKSDTIVSVFCLVLQSVRLTAIPLRLRIMKACSTSTVSSTVIPLLTS